MELLAQPELDRRRRGDVEGRHTESPGGGCQTGADDSLCFVCEAADGLFIWGKIGVQD